MGNVILTVADTKLVLRETTTKSGTSVYHCIRKVDQLSQPRFGTQIPALADDLPDTVIVDGTTVTLERGMTPDSYTDKKTGKTEPRTPRPRVSYEGEVETDTLGTKKFHFSLSVTSSGGWNIKAALTKAGLTDEEKRESQAKANATRLAGLLA